MEVSLARELMVPPLVTVEVVPSVLEIWASVVSVILLTDTEAAPARPPSPVVTPTPSVPLPITALSLAVTVTVPPRSIVELSR